MTETQVVEKAKPREFAPPRAERNEIVLWYPQGRRDMEPAFAIAQARGVRTLDLAVLRPTDRFFTQLYGVQHVDDPTEIDAERRAQDGGWDVAPAGMFAGHLALVERVERLERRLGQVIAQTAAPKQKG